MKKLNIRLDATLWREYGLLCVSGVMLIAGLLLSALSASFFTLPGVTFGWYLLAYLPVGWPVLKEAVEGLSDRDYFNEFMLMSIATVGAFCIGEYPEAVAVMLFYAIGEKFQDHAVDRAKRSIRHLLDLRPVQAVVVRAGRREQVSPQAVKVGDVVEILVGERVPLDGQLQEASASFNTAALTGESTPRIIEEGQEVLAGMIVTDRVVTLRVTKPYDQSALSRILAMVQDAAERKAPAELFISKFARIYTPIVFALAVLLFVLPWLYSVCDPSFVYLWRTWFYRALVFLVISCPCALVVSVPLCYFAGIGAASRLGILFKGGNYLDAMTRIDSVVFDKTGTLTEGNFEVQTCRAEGIDEQRLLGLMASTEQGSTHPIAKAIVREAVRRDVPLFRAEAVTEEAGLGLKAVVEGQTVLVGHIRLLSKYKIVVPDALQEVIDTLVVCAVAGRYVGHVILSDTVKADAASAVSELKKIGVTRLRILSGDRSAIVSALARRLGIAGAYGDLLPEGKVRHVEALCSEAGRHVAFVGDGINDAPVLAMSHVGIAMGGLGSDAAIEMADVVIQNDRPSRVATAIRVSRYTRRIVLQNVTLALGVKLLVLLLGAWGVVNLWEAVFADVGVTLLAVLNTLHIQHKVRDWRD